ncbi:hypothetical protein A5721_26210 [Mycobacterium vulneris]|nr:hypothetical protein A5721_26210 [Mycolicibacterium vulneris]
MPRDAVDRIVTSAFLGRDGADVIDLDASTTAATTSDLPVDQRVQQRLERSLSRLVQQPARDTIAENVAKDPAKPRWIRVPTGATTCEFCIMLASREQGPNFRGYSSEQDALFTENGQKYHKNCDCVAVPVFPGDDVWDLSPNIGDYQDLYYRAAAAAGTHRDAKKILAEMRKIQKADQRGPADLDTAPASPPKPPKPPTRARGMLGPDTPDEFGEFNGYVPPARRSQIDDFSHDDALSVLDGDVTPAESRAIARRVAAGDTDVEIPHGGHRAGTGWGKSEFGPGFTEEQVIDLVRAIIDNPTDVLPNPKIADAFELRGSHEGQAARVYVNPVGPGIAAWYVATTYPEPYHE